MFTAEQVFKFKCRNINATADHVSILVPVTKLDSEAMTTLLSLRDNTAKNWVCFIATPLIETVRTFVGGFGKKSSKFRVIHSNSTNCITLLNECISEATGEYLLIPYKGAEIHRPQLDALLKKASMSGACMDFTLPSAVDEKLISFRHLSGNILTLNDLSKPTPNWILLAHRRLLRHGVPDAGHLSATLFTMMLADANGGRIERLTPSRFRKVESARESWWDNGKTPHDLERIFSTLHFEHDLSEALIRNALGMHQKTEPVKIKRISRV